MAAQKPRGLRLSYARLHSARATVGITPHPGTLPVFQIEPISNGTVQFGPGNNHQRDEQLEFSAFSEDPGATGAFATLPDMVTCFTPGTEIITDMGSRPIETLVVGDRILTMDDGYQSIRWIGQRTVIGKGAFAPVTIAKGALGNNRTMQVSPQHRILVTDFRAELWFGSNEVLVAAKHLVNGTTITQNAQDSVTYIHLALDEHHVIFADDLATESLLLGATGLAALEDEQRAEILALFPQISNSSWAAIAARPCVKRWEAQLLAA